MADAKKVDGNAVSFAYDDVQRRLTWTFSGNVGEVAYTLREMFADERACDYRLYVHGATQKIGDAAAIPRDKKTGLAATPTEKRDAMQTVADRLARGEFNARGEAAPAIDPDVVQAIAETFGKTTATVREMLVALPKERVAAIAATEKVAARLATLRAKRIAGIDVSADIAALMA